MGRDRTPWYSRRAIARCAGSEEKSRSSFSVRWTLIPASDGSVISRAPYAGADLGVKPPTGPATQSKGERSAMTYPALDLQGRVAVVIGGTSGIGRTLALGMAQAGADVVASSRRQSEVDATAAEIEELGRR